MENEKSLVPIEKETALQIFTSGEVDPIIKKAREIVSGFTHDMSTGVSRAKTASLANKVAKFKVKIDGMGINLVADWKAQSKAVDETRKKLRDELDILKAEARKPLTDWENEEKERVEKIKARIETIKNLSHDVLVKLNGAPLEELHSASESLGKIVVDSSFEEFEFEASKEYTKSGEAIQTLIKNKVEELEREEELQRLKDEEKAREKKEYEEKLKRDAAENARLQAERKAAFEKGRIEQEKQDAIKREEYAKFQAADAERKQIEAEEREKIEKEQAEQRRIDAKNLADLRAKEAAENARLDQIRKQEEKEAFEKAATEKREADRAHTGKIRKEAKECLMQYVDESTAKKIVLAIDQGRIENVTINY
jgi:hypothetical protein